MLHGLYVLRFHFDCNNIQDVFNFFYKLVGSGVSCKLKLRHQQTSQNFCDTRITKSIYKPFCKLSVNRRLNLSRLIQGRFFVWTTGERLQILGILQNVCFKYFEKCEGAECIIYFNSYITDNRLVTWLLYSNSNFI